MKPHPKIRKILKWVGTVLTLALLAVQVGSGWLGLFRCDYRGPRIETAVSSGQVMVIYRSKPVTTLPNPAWETGFLRVFIAAREFTWVFVRPGGIVYSKTQRASVPAWYLVLAAAIPTLIAWRLDWSARRRMLQGSCPHCKFNLAGLRENAVCPECGKGRDGEVFHQ